MPPSQSVESIETFEICFPGAGLNRFNRFKASENQSYCVSRMFQLGTEWTCWDRVHRTSSKKKKRGNNYCLYGEVLFCRINCFANFLFVVTPAQERVWILSHFVCKTAHNGLKGLHIIFEIWWEKLWIFNIVAVIQWSLIVTVTCFEMPLKKLFSRVGGFWSFIIIASNRMWVNPRLWREVK